MINRRTTRAAIAATAVVAAVGTAGIAQAHHGRHPARDGQAGWGPRPWSLGRTALVTSLGPIAHDPPADNGSNVSGAAWIARAGRKVDVHLVATGLDALPHAIHVHALAGGAPSSCPTASLRSAQTADGLIDDSEAGTITGPVRISLVTSGWAAPGAAFDLQRYLPGDGNGVLAYHRVIKVPRWVSRDIEGAVIDVHGEDLNNNGVYDGAEAALPVACGVIARDASLPSWWWGRG